MIDKIAEYVRLDVLHRAADEVGDEARADAVLSDLDALWVTMTSDEREAARIASRAAIGLLP